MTKPNSDSPAVQRAIGQIILAANDDPAFYAAFLEDWRQAVAGLEIDEALRQDLIDNMESSGLSAFEMVALLREDGAAMATARDRFAEGAGWE